MFENYKKYRYTLDDYPVTYIKIGDGFRAIENTVKFMVKAINESAKNIRVRSVASDIIKNVPERDKWGECDSIYQWTASNTHYVKDIYGEEMFQSPLVALDMIDKGFAFIGDCDCISGLVLSLLKSVGYPVGIRIAGYENDGKYTHVYGLVYLFNQWIPCDAIKKGVPLGWENEGAIITKDYEV